MNTFNLPNERAMLDFGAFLSQLLPTQFIFNLFGPLGAGKTTLVRGIIKAAGYADKVKSPTYGIVESYELQGKTIYHFDLYRLKEAKELQHIGIRDYFDQAICLIEWAEKGENYLPRSDLDCYIEVLPNGRKIQLVAHSAAGNKILDNLG